MICMFVCIWAWILIDSIIFRWGCSSVVERMLCMYEAPGSIPGISMVYFGVIKSVNVFSAKPTWKWLLTLDGVKMRQPGIEPGSTAWKAAMLTTIPLTLYSAPKWQPNQYFLVLKERGEILQVGFEPERLTLHRSTNWTIEGVNFAWTQYKILSNLLTSRLIYL